MFVNVKAAASERHAACVWVCMVLSSVMLSGCGSSAYQSAPVDVAKARGVLEDVMESWKGGEAAESLQQQQPPVVVQDFDWIGGAKLLAYEIVNEDKAVNANLVAKVKLTLQDKQGAKVEKTVTYLVGTAPKLTVFRDSFQ